MFCPLCFSVCKGWLVCRIISAGNILAVSVCLSITIRPSVRILASVGQHLCVTVTRLLFAATVSRAWSGNHWQRWRQLKLVFRRLLSFWWHCMSLFIICCVVTTSVVARVTVDSVRCVSLLVYVVCLCWQCTLCVCVDSVCCVCVCWQCTLCVYVYVVCCVSVLTVCVVCVCWQCMLCVSVDSVHFVSVLTGYVVSV